MREWELIGGTQKHTLWKAYVQCPNGKLIKSQVVVGFVSAEIHC